MTWKPLNTQKCKPLSITIAVDHPSRRILGVSSFRNAPKGKLSNWQLKNMAAEKT